MGLFGLCHTPIPTAHVSALWQDYRNMARTGTSGAAAKARTAAKNVRKTSSTGARRIHKKTHFYRPRTLHTPRTPKYARKAIPSRNKLDQYAILRVPLTTESALKKIEDNNTLVFMCDPRANKYQISEAFQKMHNVKPVKINTLIRPDGQKKAFIRISADTDALEVANKIGII